MLAHASAEFNDSPSLRDAEKMGSLVCISHSSKRENRTMNDISAATKDKLVTDFRVVIADAEELLRMTANQAGDKVADLRLRVQDHLATARVKLAETEAAIVDQTKAVARATDDYVHDNPWRSIGIGAGIGFIVGLLIGRR